YYSNVTGVKFGTQVVYEGYPIGQVEEVTPEEKDGRMLFRVDFGINQGWRIPKDSLIEIAAPGLLAAVTLSIHAGAEKVSLKPGDQVLSKERSDIFAVVSSVAGQLGDLTENNIKPLLNNVNDTVISINRIIEKEGMSLFQDARNVTNDLADLVSLMAERVPRIADNIEAFSSKMNDTSDEFQKLLTPENRKKLEAIIQNLDKAAQSTQVVAKEMQGMVVDNEGDLRKAIGETRYIVESVSRHIDSINQNMEGAARNMYEFTRQIRQNPGLLLGSEPPVDQAKKQ
ncbi:MAG: MlaD family protein, partial [Rhodospirillales bacterium]